MKRLAGLMSALAVLTVSACAAIPLAGDVHTGRAQVDDLQGAVTVPEGPAIDASARSIVEGFLVAGVAGLTADFSVARQYLDAASAAAWDPLDGAMVSSSITVEQTADDQVVAKVDLAGHLDKQGNFVESEVISESVTFDLVQVDGQWRIAAAPPGLIISQQVFEQQYQQVSLQFLSIDRSQFVPDVRYYPVGNLETSVLQGLLQGPGAWLSAAVTTAAPPGVGLMNNTVTVDDKATAHVILEPEAVVRGADELFFEQIAASLSTSGVREVEIATADNETVVHKDVPLTAVSTSELLAILDADDTVAPVEGTDTPASESLGSDAHALAVGVSGFQVALLGSDELVAVPRQGEPAATLLTGGGLARPSVDRYDWVWTAVGDGGLRVVSATGQVVKLEPSWLAGRTVRSVRMAADGVRLAVVSTGTAGARLDLAAVVRDQAGLPVSMGGPVEIGARVVVAQQVVWAGETTLVALGRSDDSAVMVQVPVSGLSKTITGVPEAEWIAASGSMSSLVAVTSQGRLWRYSGHSWTAAIGTEVIRDPAYAG